jgi:hypothetical protein
MQHSGAMNRKMPHLEAVALVFAGQPPSITRRKYA